MKNKTATLIGATGLIGSHLLEILQDDPEFSPVKVIVRRPFQCSHPKVKVAVIDFADKEVFKSAIEGSDVVFCAVGTTSKKVKGDKDEYRKVDHDIPVNAAKLCSETGCRQFVYVSSVGADSKNKNFYLRLKGEVEDTLRNLNIESILIFRPSLLLGKRNEFRSGEFIGTIFMKPVSFLLPSNLKPLKARCVAESMVEASKKNIKGVRMFHYNDMIKLLFFIHFLAAYAGL